MARVCGNPKCGASSAMDESITFGSGELDDYGYWEFPCALCARAFEKKHPEYGSCWPFIKKVREEYQGMLEELDRKREERESNV